MGIRSVDLDGKVALVTGGAKGLGAGCVKGLVERGATVVALDLDLEAGMTLVESLLADGRQARFIKLDVGEEGSWADALAQVEDSFEKIDILVNNAGLMEFQPLGEMDVELFDRVMRVNVRGTFLGCKLVLPAMRRAGSGSIINIASISGMIANDQGYAAYAASKGAIRQLTKAAAVDYSAFNIRVNSVHPGAMWTARSEETLSNPELHDLAIGRVLMRRAADTSEVANVVAFLASDEASYTTGAEFVVDGGYLAC